MSIFLICYWYVNSLYVNLLKLEEILMVLMLVTTMIMLMK